MQQCLRVRERKKKKEKRPPKHIFKSIYIFNKFNVGRKGEFIVAASELGDVLVVRKINYVSKA